MSLSTVCKEKKKEFQCSSSTVVQTDWREFVFQWLQKIILYCPGSVWPSGKGKNTLFILLSKGFCNEGLHVIDGIHFVKIFKGAALWLRAQTSVEELQPFVVYTLLSGVDCMEFYVNRCQAYRRKKGASLFIFALSCNVLVLESDPDWPQNHDPKKTWVKTTYWMNKLVSKMTN